LKGQQNCFVFGRSHRTKQQGYNGILLIFLRCDMQQQKLVELRVDKWSNELVVGQSPVGMNVSTEVEDIVGIRHQTATGKDTTN
jgi:hypothetical protein